MATQLTFFQPPPYQAEFVDENRMLTPAWQKWFQQLYSRNGGALALPNTPLADGTVSLANLYVGQTNTIVYTCPTGLTTVIDSFQVVNSDGVAHTISVYLVPALGTPSASNQVATNLSVAANTTFAISNIASSVVGSGGTVVAIANASSALKAVISGRQVS